MLAATTRLVEVTPEFPERKAQTLGVDWEGSFLDYGSLSHVNREFTRALGPAVMTAFPHLGGRP